MNSEGHRSAEKNAQTAGRINDVNCRSNFKSWKKMGANETFQFRQKFLIIAVSYTVAEISNFGERNYLLGSS